MFSLRIELNNCFLLLLYYCIKQYTVYFIRKMLNESVIRHGKKKQLTDPSTERYLNFTLQLDYTTTYCLN